MSTPEFIQKVTANMMAYMMYKPFGPVRPSKKTVIDRTMKDIGFDLDGFNSWEKEDFDLPNGDIVIPASYYPIPNAKGVAILAHGYGQNRYALIPQAEIFREIGYSIILFDQRHFGVSKAPNSTFGVREATDLIALANWARQKLGKDTRIAALGVSMGAMSVMNAISRTDLIHAAIEDCGPSGLEVIFDTFFKVVFGEDNPCFEAAVRKQAKKYGLSVEGTSPVESVRKSKIPLLVIHSEGDRTVPVRCATEILAASKNSKSRMQLFDKKYDHAFSINERELYKSAVGTFLSDVFETDRK